MRYLTLSDIHANLPALETVLIDAQKRGYDQILSLGDVVGYGPHPNECTEWVRANAKLCIPGNHDWAAIGKMGTEDFNPAAREANLWTQKVLAAENRSYLQELPTTLIQEGFTLVHGSLREPIWEYVTDNWIAQQSFDLLTTPILFHGHTHVPVLFRERKDTLPQIFLPRGQERVVLDKGRFLINPGSIGQPRDGDPRASYLIYNDSVPAIEFYRVDYPIAETQQVMRQRGLPEILADRLSLGQ